MKQSVITTPVVLIIYKRADTTRQVLKAISEVKPSTLFVISDGAHPDHADENEKVAEVRALIEQIAWDCDIATNYAEYNLGLRNRVVSGLDWVFEDVERAIILEDDCVPDQSFFYFCEELLEHYQEDERIMVISGDNYQKGRQRSPYSFYFSRYNHCWGWATWRRAWQHYNDTMELWPQIRDSGLLMGILDQKKSVVRYWTNIFDAVYAGRIDSWAYRWTYSCWLQSGLTVLPSVNLVSNIGFGEQATHTKYAGSKANQPRFSLNFPLVYPPFIVRDSRADSFTERDHFGISFKKWVKRRIANFLRLFGFFR